MKRQMKWMTGAVLFSLLSLASAPKANAAVIINLLDQSNTPGTTISGAPGSTIGWGVDISSDTYWLIVTSVQSTFAQFPGGLSSSATTPVEDYLTGYFSTNTVSPGNPLNMPFVPSTAGLGFSIRPDAVVGTTEFGEIVLNYILFDGDPNGNGSPNQVDEQGSLSSSDIVVRLGANVTAVEAKSEVPEPGTTLLLGFGLAQVAAIGYLRRRRG